MTINKPAAVRNERKPRHGWFDYEVLDVFGPDLGPFGIAVYMVLARHCYGGFRVTKGQRELAAQACMSKTELQRTLKKMIDLGLVVEHKGRTVKSVTSYDLTDVKELVEEMWARAKARNPDNQSGPVRTRSEEGSGERLREALDGNLYTNLPDFSGDAATATQDDLEGIEENEASNLVLGRDMNWSSQDQMAEEEAEESKTVENGSSSPANWSSDGPHLVQSEPVLGPDLVQLASRSNRQETRNKKQELKGTPPLGAATVQNSPPGDPEQRHPALGAGTKKTPSPGDPYQVRWTAFIAELKRGLYDVALGLEIEKGWNPVLADMHDFKACFSAWWLLDVERGPAGTLFLTHAHDEAATQAGIVKYRKRLSRLLRKFFSLGEDEPVNFRVLRPPQQQDAAKTSDGHHTNGEIPDGDREAWEQVQRLAKEHLLRLAQANPAVKPEWVEQAIEPAQLEAVEHVNGKRVWMLRSPEPATMRVVLGLLKEPVRRQFGSQLEIVVLDESALQRGPEHPGGESP